MEKLNEDFEIILNVLSGDRNAYAALVRKYETRVRGYCTTMLSDRTLAEDAAQEIFIKAYQGLEKFNAKSSFSTWLYRITANHCTDLLRKKHRHKAESLEALIENEGEKIEGLFATPPEAQNAAGQSELVAQLLSCLAETSRTILTLREIHGLSYQEMSAALKCSVDAVKSRLKRARQEMMEKSRHFLKAGDV